MSREVHDARTVETRSGLWSDDVVNMNGSWSLADVNVTMSSQHGLCLVSDLISKSLQRVIALDDDEDGGVMSCQSWPVPDRPDERCRRPKDGPRWDE